MKSSVKILELMKENREIAIPEIALKIGLTTRAVEKQIKKLQENGQLKRIGPDKGGYWEVIEDEGK